MSAVIHGAMFDHAFPFMGGKFMDYFLSLGSWDLTAGDTQQGFLGSRFQNILGMDWRLVFSPFGWLLGPGRRNPFTDMVMGLGDDVSFTYGARINATYGGPYADIVRGTRIRKMGSATPKIASSGAPGWPNPVRDALEGFGQADDRERNSLVARYIAEGDTATFVAVTALGVCLTLITNALEIIAHAKFGEYDKTHGHARIVADQGADGGTIKSGDDVTLRPTKFDANSDIASGFLDIRETHRWLPRRLMALIYHIEVAGTLLAYALNWIDGLKRTTVKLTKIMLWVALPPVMMFHLAYVRRKAGRAIGKGGLLLGFLAAIAFLVLVILMFCAVV